MGNSHNKIAPASEFDIEIISIPHVKSPRRGTRKSKNSRSLPNRLPENENEDKMFVLKENTRGHLNRNTLRLPLKDLDLKQIDLGINLYTHRELIAPEQIKTNLEDPELIKTSSMPVQQPSDLHSGQISLEEFQISPDKDTQKVNLRYTEEYFQNLIKFSES